MSDAHRSGHGVLIARGREAAVYDRGDGTVLKVFADPAAAETATREARVLDALAPLGIAAPRLVELLEVDGHPAIAMTLVTGEDWIRRLGRRPLDAVVVGRWLARAHLRVHEAANLSALPTVHARLRHRLEHNEAVGPARRDAALARLGALDALGGDRLCHGDFHLENCIGPLATPTVIDWGNASCGPPAADVARTWVILRFGEPGAETPRIVRALAPIARAAILRQYLATYRRASPGALEDLDAWQVVQATARIGETTESETTAIRGWLARRPR